MITSSMEKNQRISKILLLLVLMSVLNLGCKWRYIGKDEKVIFRINKCKVPKTYKYFFVEELKNIIYQINTFDSSFNIGKSYKLLYLSDDRFAYNVGAIIKDSLELTFISINHEKYQIKKGIQHPNLEGVNSNNFIEFCNKKDSVHSKLSGGKIGFGLIVNNSKYTFYPINV